MNVVVLRNYISFAFLFALLAFNYTNAKPHTVDESATMIFTMWDIATDKSYIVDLEIPVLEIKENKKSFEIDVLSIINKNTKAKIQSVKHFRWSVVGGINNKDKILGYVGAYANEEGPEVTRTANTISQRVKKLRLYLKANEYAGNVNEVSVATPEYAGHYNQIWQGNFWGLTVSKLEGKGGGQPLDMWSFFATSWTDYDKRYLGQVELNERGILKFKAKKDSS